MWGVGLKGSTRSDGESESISCYAGESRRGISTVSRLSFGYNLLLVVIFSLSGIFSCLYHWDKLRSLRRSNDDLEVDGDQGPSKMKFLRMNLKQDKNRPRSISDCDHR